MDEAISAPHSKALRCGRVSIPNCSYFLTKCTQPATSEALVRQDCAQIVIDSLRWCRDNGWWRLLCFCVMPGHYHVAFALGEAKPLSDVVASISRFTSARINRILGREGPFWQDGFYDHAIRDREDFEGILQYVHANPVEAGISQAPEDWPYSTASPAYAHLIDWEWLGPSFRPSGGTRYRFDPGSLPHEYR